jgi:hypothetical protein
MDRYTDLSEHLKIDLSQIDQEIIQGAQNIQLCSELAAEASDEENMARLAYDMVVAKVSSQLREPEEGKKARSETQISSEILLYSEVIAAKEKHNQAKFQAELCSSLAGSMRMKANLVRDAASLTVAGYITPTSYAEKRVKLIRRE